MSWAETENSRTPWVHLHVKFGSQQNCTCCLVSQCYFTHILVSQWTSRIPWS